MSTQLLPTFPKRVVSPLPSIMTFPKSNQVIHCFLNLVLAFVSAWKETRGAEKVLHQHLFQILTYYKIVFLSTKICWPLQGYDPCAQHYFAPVCFSKSILSIQEQTVSIHKGCVISVFNGNVWVFVTWGELTNYKITHAGYSLVYTSICLQPVLKRWMEMDFKCELKMHLSEVSWHLSTYHPPTFLPFTACTIKQIQVRHKVIFPIRILIFSVYQLFLFSCFFGKQHYHSYTWSDKGNFSCCWKKTRRHKQTDSVGRSVVIVSLVGSSVQEKALMMK